MFGFICMVVCIYISCCRSCSLFCEIIMIGFRCSCLGGRLSIFTNHFQMNSEFSPKLRLLMFRWSLSPAACIFRQVLPTFYQPVHVILGRICNLLQPMRPYLEKFKHGKQGCSVRAQKIFVSYMCSLIGRLIRIR